MFPVDKAALQRPDLLAGRAPRTINMSTIGDDLLRPARRLRAEIEALVVYNSNPVAVAPESPKVVAGFSREDLFTVVLEHSRPTRPTTRTTSCPRPRSWSTGTCTWLRPHRRAAEPPGDRAAGRGQAEYADVPRARGAHGFDEPCFATATKTLCRTAYGDGRFQPAAGARLRHAAIARCAVRAGRFPTPRASANSSASGWRAGLDGLPDHLPNYELAGSRPPIRWR
jgi:hypothetical protein